MKIASYRKITKCERMNPFCTDCLSLKVYHTHAYASMCISTCKVSDTWTQFTISLQRLSALETQQIGICKCMHVPMQTHAFVFVCILYKGISISNLYMLCSAGFKYSRVDTRNYILKAN